MPFHVTFCKVQKILNVPKSGLLTAIAESFVVLCADARSLNFKIWDSDWNDWVDAEFDKIPEKCKLKLLQNPTRDTEMQSYSGPLLQSLDTLYEPASKTPPQSNYDSSSLHSSMNASYELPNVSQWFPSTSTHIMNEQGNGSQSIDHQQVAMSTTR